MLVKGKVCCMLGYLSDRTVFFLLEQIGRLDIEIEKKEKASLTVIAVISAEKQDYSTSMTARVFSIRKM